MPLATDRDTKPKALRLPNKDLHKIQCIYSEATRTTIIQKDANVDPPQDQPADLQEILEKMSNIILNQKFIINIETTNNIKKALKDALPKTDPANRKLFEDGSEESKKLGDSLADSCRGIIDKDTKIKNYAHELFHEAKEHTATKVASKLPDLILDIKHIITPIVTHITRNEEKVKAMLELHISGLNFDNYILKLLHNALPTANSDSSINSLSSALDNIKVDVYNNTTNIKHAENCILKAAVRIGNLKSHQVEQTYKSTEDQLRLHKIESIGIGTDKHFRVVSDKEQTALVAKYLQEKINSPQPTKIDIFKPKGNNKKFEPLALLTFHSSADKFNFEKTFANFKRATPGENLSISRPQPPKTAGPNDIESIQSVKEKLGSLYNAEIKKQTGKYPGTVPWKELTNDEINSMPVTIKTKQRPFATYYEFLCPSNNTTFMPYTAEHNPFLDYCFREAIPNPVTRAAAANDPKYKVRFQLHPQKRK